MNKGVLLFAHNNRQIDYAHMAVVSGGLARKHLKVPVSLVTDDSTIAWMKQSKIFSTALEIFDKIISVQRPETVQHRSLHDGNERIVTPFNNSNRPSVYDLTPYDRTLLIDSDYFIFSDNLNNYWNVDSDILISPQYNDIVGKERIGYHDVYISDTGVKLLWATTVMFTKNEQSKLFFDLVEHIRRNYNKFADIFRFDNRIYRNDISFSLARHILYGFETDDDYSLPPVLSSIDRDLIYDVDKDGKITFLLNNNLGNSFTAASVKDKDIHIMNKASITRNINKLMELI